MLSVPPFLADVCHHILLNGFWKGKKKKGAPQLPHTKGSGGGANFA